LYFPRIGDVYQEIREDELFSVYMVVAIHEGTVVLGGNQHVFWNDFNDYHKWKLLYNIVEMK
jgi:hypothetical protein